jgi:hypothetical protein
LEENMIQLRLIAALVALICALPAAPAFAQSHATGVSDVLSQQSFQEFFHAQQERELRRLLRSRTAQAEEMVQTPAPAPTVSPFRAGDVARLEALHRRHTRISRVLLLAGAGAMVAGFAGYVHTDREPGLTWAQGVLIGTGFGATLAGSQSWDRAADAHARAEQLREVQLADQSPGS